MAPLTLVAAARHPAPPVTAAVQRTRDWFEVNSGWAPPDPETLADWLAEGASRCPDDCWADAAGECDHGLATWATLLRLQATEDAAVAALRLPPS